MVREQYHREEGEKWQKKAEAEDDPKKAIRWFLRSARHWGRIGEISRKGENLLEAAKRCILISRWNRAERILRSLRKNRIFHSEQYGNLRATAWMWTIWLEAKKGNIARARRFFHLVQKKFPPSLLPPEWPSLLNSILQDDKKGEKE
ncbi:MAG: hypothetical protein V2G48_04395 [bacterium JZ-2024 1]